MRHSPRTPSRLAVRAQKRKAVTASLLSGMEPAARHFTVRQTGAEQWCCLPELLVV